jgi:hypothetical protein
MVSLRIHGRVKSFGHPTYGLQHWSTININHSTINAHQFNNQLDRRSTMKRTNVHAEIWTRILQDWKRALTNLAINHWLILDLNCPSKQKFLISCTLLSNFFWFCLNGLTFAAYIVVLKPKPHLHAKNAWLKSWLYLRLGMEVNLITTIADFKTLFDILIKQGLF